MNGEDLLQWYDRTKSHLLTRIIRPSFDGSHGRFKINDSWMGSGLGITVVDG